jgi:fructose-1,6-bisphosphatase/inositol monophosphatase family enzyme
MKLPDPAAVSRIMEEVAAEEMLPRFRSLNPDDIREKSGPGDLVTVVDEAVERRLSSALTELLPGSSIVGEEGCAADPSAIGRLAEEGPVWIIDPLDGTWNFAHGIDRFASIVALAVNGETVAGWILDPMDGVTACAVKGEGAYAGSRRLTVAESLPVDQMVAIVTDFLFPAEEQGAVARMKDSFAEVYYERCAGVEYLHLVEGKAHVAVPPGTKPWDHAAGVLLHREAGGYSAMIDGRAYGPLVREGRLALAPDRDSWDLVKRIWSDEPGPSDLA